MAASALVYPPISREREGENQDQNGPDRRTCEHPTRSIAAPEIKEPRRRQRDSLRLTGSAARPSRLSRLKAGRCNGRPVSFALSASEAFPRHRLPSSFADLETGA